MFRSVQLRSKLFALAGIALLLTTGFTHANTITVTIADNDSSVTKTLSSATGNYSITNANFLLADFTGIVGNNIEGTITTNDIANNVNLSRVQVSIGATLTAAAPKTLTVTVTDSNFKDTPGFTYTGTSRVGGQGNVTPGMTVKNEGDFSSPTTTVIITSTSTDGLTFPTNSNTLPFTAGQPGGTLTITDILSGTFLTTGDNVNTLNGTAQAQFAIPEPASMITGMTGVVGLCFGAWARRRKVKS